MSTSPYGERPAMQTTTIRRSFTAPTRQLSFHEKVGLDNPDANANTLYTHPSARILSFSPPTESIKSDAKTEILADTDYPVDAVETLPWRSRTETLVATGVMVIEKVRGSTNFLKCQSMIHAILRNSQCWCVDGESKFVLRVRKFQYYRIELPSATDEDKAKVEELKKVLPTVLRYERTPCPFIRAFTVDLPDDAITPRRKGQWKRRDSSQSNIHDTETPLVRRTATSKSWNVRSPPTSYPRHGPSSAYEDERGRNASPSSVHRRASFFENYRNNSPGGYLHSDDGTDSEQQDSEHDSEVLSHTDRSANTSPHKHLDKLHLQKKPHPLVNTSLSPPDQSGFVALEQDTGEVPQNLNKSMLSTTSSTSVISDQGNHHQEPLTTDHEPKSRQVSNGSKDSSSATAPVSDKVIDHSFPDVGHVTHENQLTSTNLTTSLDTEDTSHMTQTAETAGNLGIATTFPRAGTKNEKRKLSADKSAYAVDFTEKRISALGDLTVQSSNAERSSKSSNPAVQAFDKPALHSYSFNEKESDPSKDSSSASSNAAEDRNVDAIVIDQGKELFEKGKSKATSIGTEQEQDPDLAATTDDSKDVAKITQYDDIVIQSHIASTALGNLSKEEDNKDTEHEGEEETDEDMTSSEEEEDEDEEEDDEADEETSSDDDDDDSVSVTSSADSFHTLASPVMGSRTTTNADLQRYLVENNSNNFPGHRRDTSEVTITASSRSDPAFMVQDMKSIHDGEGGHHDPLNHVLDKTSDITPTVVSTDPPDNGVLRRRGINQRSFSPLPPASTIFTGNEIQHDSGSGHMTKVILQKIIIKPIEVAVLFVHILARIAGGATVSDLLSGDLFKRPDNRRRVSSFADHLGSGSSGGKSDTEDDYGVPIRGRRKSSERLVAMVLDDEGCDTSRRGSAEDVD